MTGPRGLPLGRIWRAAIGFPGAHAMNAGLSLVFTLAQTLVLARVLDGPLYARIVAANTVGLYLLPINQAVARANFILLRERLVTSELRATSAGDGAPEAAAAFTASQAVLSLACLVVPLLLGGGGASWGLLAGYLFVTVFSNVWYSELQMAMLAAEHALRFEVLSLARRLLSYATLAWLWFARDFPAFVLVMALQTLAFHLFLVATAGRDVALVSLRGLAGADLRAHGGRLWTSLQATVAEWLTLNAPYMIFTVRFGIGPGLVAVDALMKLLRVVVSVTRNLCEIALPRVSRAVFSGRPDQARSATAAALGGGLAAGGLLALALVLFEGPVFALLLGPNNTVPAGAGLPAGITLLAGAAFAAGAHLVGHAGAARAIRGVLVAAAVAMGAFAAAALTLRPDVLGALWMFAAAFALVSAVAVMFLLRLLTPQGRVATVA